MTKQLFTPTDTYELYKSTTLKCNLTGAELSTILYCLEGYVAGLDDVEYDEIANTNEQQDQKLVNTVERIFVELQSVTDNYYAQLEAQNENNYAECVDYLVNTMGGK